MTVTRKGDFIVIDVGNTSTGIARFTAGELTAVRHIKGGILSEAAACCDAIKGAAYQNEHHQTAPEAVVIASVVPGANRVWQRVVKRELNLPLLFVSNALPLEITIDYPEPATIGADRLAAACGALRRYGAPLVVADFGTALTFDVLTADRRYVGGVIAPGLPLMTDYLFERTALLPRVELKGECPPLGRSTQEAMRIGAQIGYRGIVREILHYLETTQACQFRLIATGGYADWALTGSGIEYTLDQHLTLFGLGCIGEHAL